jgi:hypothetical protein
MPRFINKFNNQSGPTPVLHILSSTLLLSAVAWLAIQLAIVGFQPQFGTNGINAQALSINNTIYDYQWRLIGMGGALSACYYAARWPTSRSATFMAFIATMTISFSFVPIDLPNAYQVLYYGTSRCSTDGISNTWCALQYGAQIISCVQTGLVFCLGLWALARHIVADTYPHLVITEHVSHILTWIGFAAYACWCFAAVTLNSDFNVNSNTAEFINQWNSPAMHIVAIVGLSLAAYVSWGSTRGARLNSLLFVVIGLHILAPAVVWNSRQLWEKQYGTPCALSFSNYQCMAKNAVVAGMGGVAGVFLVLSLVYTVLLLRPIPTDVYAVQQYHVQNEPVKTDPYIANGYANTTTTYQSSTPAVYEAPKYNVSTPTNRYSTSNYTTPTGPSPYPDV